MPTIDITKLIASFIEANPLINTLLVLIVLDVISGTVLAAVKRKLNSSTGFIGVTRKAMILIVVEAATVLEKFANGLPIGDLCAMFYIWVEAVSLVENAAGLGVPIPGALRDALLKLRETQQGKIATAKESLSTPPKNNGIVPLLIAGGVLVWLAGCEGVTGRITRPLPDGGRVIIDVEEKKVNAELELPEK
jgi:toxin secretion/phage lysis holin